MLSEAGGDQSLRLAFVEIVFVARGKCIIWTAKTCQHCDAHDDFLLRLLFSERRVAALGEKAGEAMPRPLSRLTYQASLRCFTAALSVSWPSKRIRPAMPTLGQKRSRTVPISGLPTLRTM